jgi:predicted nucleic acid-binding protein
VIYFDSSYVVKCYLNEAGADKVQALAAKTQGIASCEIARLEFAATLHRHLREGRINEQRLEEANGYFADDQRNGVWRWLPPSSSLIESASGRVLKLAATVFLRSVDALHLTCAVENGFAEIYTNDRHMMGAAPHFGLKAVNIIA